MSCVHPTMTSTGSLTKGDSSMRILVQPVPVPIRRLLVLTMTGALSVFAMLAAAQSPVTDFSAGQPSGTYRFVSWTPKTIGELIKGNPGADGVNVTGHLFLPAGSDAKVPAVILIHGSGGIYKAMLEFWPRQFNAAGIAVLSVDSFGPRGVQGTAEDQSLVPFAADTADAFAALQLLATHPRIDASRIAVMGFSRGGITAFRSNLERVVAGQKLPGGLRFAAHIPVYSGGCLGLFRTTVRPGVYGKAPMLWVHGDADDYTPVGACREYAEQIGKAGTPVQFVTIAGARHKFDEDDPRRFFVAAAQRVLETCPLEFDLEAGVVIDRFTGQRIPGNQIGAVSKKLCSATGANVEGNTGHRAKAAEVIVGFLKTTFAR